MNTASPASKPVPMVQRVQDILLRPRATWPQIDAEDGSPAPIYRSYLVFLAAIPAVAGFIGTSLIDIGMLGVTVRIPILRGLVSMVASYVLSLVMVYVLALVANALAPYFQGRKDMGSAFKLVAYSITASMVGGIFALLPALSLLGVVAGLYSVYLLYTGIPVLMKAPSEKSVGYTAALLVCGIVAGLLVGMVVHMFAPTPSGWMGAGDAGPISIHVPSK